MEIPSKQLRIPSGLNERLDEFLEIWGESREIGEIPIVIDEMQKRWGESAESVKAAEETFNFLIVTEVIGAVFTQGPPIPYRATTKVCFAVKSSVVC